MQAATNIKALEEEKKKLEENYKLTENEKEGKKPEEQVVENVVDESYDKEVLNKGNGVPGPRRRRG